ncbi:MAG: bifunctional metallophosphatase/5'-nucleotidase, partial [Cyanobacteria bacterium REEB65]|nr:bifunctional metallophosphatase/5'-nucleotidase [Cyanobacteria bacterium REEB65]
MIRRLLCSIAVSLAIAPAALASPVTLTLLHTNDVHSHLVPYDTKKLKSVGGMAREATMIEGAEAQEPGHVLVLDAGDAFQGTPMFNFFAGKAEYDA